ncbi:hypothetical protein [Breoghania sp.]|uniref:hypothetical protein n=1 Tax=Breoghania sp. TaxID=2065378 RepID=UPI00261FFCC1|nr:hypothetical protein [Breoghania sp.]MDJ0931575.1 hypothetical protein [Breoghania sp.]
MPASIAAAQSPVVVGTPSQAGPVDGSDQNSDEFIWTLFTQFVAPATSGKEKPVIFETWASDADTFNTAPKWPDPSEGKKFQTSILELATTPSLHGAAAGASLAKAIDVPCKTPGNAGVGGLPSTGTPKPCVAEETRRNKPQFDYIVENGFNTQKDLAGGLRQTI